SPFSNTFSVHAEDEVEDETAEEVVEEEEVEEEAAGEEVAEANLPTADDLQEVAENSKYILKADPETGHFIAINKQNGKELRSFPNPEGWGEGGASQVWQAHLQS